MWLSALCCIAAWYHHCKLISILPTTGICPVFSDGSIDSQLYVSQIVLKEIFTFYKSGAVYEIVLHSLLMVRVTCFSGGPVNVGRLA